MALDNIKVVYFMMLSQRFCGKTAFSWLDFSSFIQKKKKTVVRLTSSTSLELQNGLKDN